jgi:hypothetical protein
VLIFSQEMIENSTEEKEEKGKERERGRRNARG